MAATLTECAEQTIQKHGEFAQRRIASGSEDIFDRFLVRYAKASPEERDKFHAELEREGGI